MVSLVLAFMVSLFVSGLIIRLSRSGALAWDDHDLQGVQKFHAGAVPRVGGLAIAVGLAALAGWVALSRSGPAVEFALVLLCGAPALAAGLLEDFTKQVGIKTRLLATALSGVLAFFLLGAQLGEVQLPGLDWLMTFTLFSLLFTAVAVAGVANAVKVIDGYNGLASVVAMISLLSLAYVGWQVGDNLVVSVALGGVGALLGFFIWNWPRGLIFLGDGGAYFVGYLVAILSVPSGGTAPWRGLAVVPVPALHLPGVRNAVLHLAQAPSARRQPGRAGWPAPAHVDLPPPGALGRGPA